MTEQQLPSIFDDSPQGLIERAARLPKLTQSGYAETLGKHVSNISNEWNPGVGATFDGRKGDTFFRHSLKRVHAQQCAFRHCSFARAAGTGSTWENCLFENCDFSDSNFQFADFSGSRFLLSKSSERNEGTDNILRGATFSGVNFDNADFDQTSVMGCNFSQSDFTNARIASCDISSSTFEGAVFRGASISHTDINNVNIEYADFTGADLDQVRFSLLQFPFVFGLEPDAIQSNRTIISTNDRTHFPDGHLHWERLLDLIPDLVSYYEERAIFFPIANLYLLSKRYDLAKEYMGLGVKVALELTNYRDLKHLCKLARVSNCFQSDELLSLFHLIEQQRLVTKGRSKKGDLAYQSHSGEIRHYLTGVESDADTFAVHIKLKNKGEAAQNLAQTRFVEDLSEFLHNFGVDMSWEALEYVEHSPPVIQITGDQNTVTINNNAPQQLAELQKQHSEVIARLETLEKGDADGIESKASLQKEAFRWQKAVAIMIAANFLMSHGGEIREAAEDLYQYIAPPPRRQ